MTAAPLLFAACLFVQDGRFIQTGEPPAAEPPGPPPGEAVRREAAAALDAALGAPLSEPFTVEPGTSMSDALAALLPDQTILPDGPRLDLEGIDLRDLPIRGGFTLPAGALTKRAALEELLETTGDVPLTAQTNDGVVRITTQDHAEGTLVTRVYPVRDILEAAGPAEAARIPLWRSLGGGMRGEFGGGAFSLPAGVAARQLGQPRPGAAPIPQSPAAADAGEAKPLSPLEVALVAEQPLIDVIQSVTGGSDAGGGWLEIDGEGGSVEAFNGILVIRQTEDVHRQIAVLLAELRAAFEVRPWTVEGAAPAGAPAPDAP